MSVIDVQALLAAKRVSFSKHGQVRGYFNRELIKTGILPKSLGQVYSKAFEYRQKFDYVDFSVPDAEMVSEYIKKAKEKLEKSFKKAKTEANKKLDMSSELTSNT